ncbi:MAG: hypothetical protein DRG78_09660 [Epsilonproteobacteria bacterium]|nr:MAG: hypothetical protein DRG78_09660 [Campylobacterota bacterium]
MAIGPIGSAIFTNQMTASASSVQNAHNNRVDVQNIAAQAAANEKDEKVLEVRPTEESAHIDPDRESEKDRADEQNKQNKRDKEEKNEEDFDESLKYKLDIKV